MVGILDYGIGNVGSIQNMLKKAGASGTIVHTVSELEACDKLILPGVGAFDEGMDRLDQSGLRVALDSAVAQGKPVLGICLGMQMLGLSSEEGKREGWSKLYWVTRENNPARKLYDKYGEADDYVRYRLSL